MSNVNSDRREIKARVLRQIRVLPSEKPGVAVLEIVTDKRSDFFILTPDSMDQVAGHLTKFAASLRNMEQTSRTSGPSGS